MFCEQNLTFPIKNFSKKKKKIRMLEKKVSSKQTFKKQFKKKITKNFPHKLTFPKTIFLKKCCS